MQQNMGSPLKTFVRNKSRAHPANAALISVKCPVTSCQPTLQNGVLTVSIGGENFNISITTYKENGLFFNSEVFEGFSQEFINKYYQDLLSDKAYSNIEYSGNTFAYYENPAFLGFDTTIEDNYTLTQSVCSALLSGDITIEEMFFD